MDSTTAGSSPAFPTINDKFSFISLLNQIKLNQKKKNLIFSLILKKKFISFLFLIKNISLISKFNLLKINNNYKAKIFLFFYIKQSINFFVKIFSISSQKFFITLKSLILLDKKCASSVFLLSTSKGFLTHKDCIKNQISGHLIGFVSL